jgi:hypothetical protein
MILKVSDYFRSQILWLDLTSIHSILILLAILGHLPQMDLMVRNLFLSRYAGLSDKIIIIWNIQS